MAKAKTTKLKAPKSSIKVKKPTSKPKSFKTRAPSAVTGARG